MTRYVVYEQCWPKFLGQMPDANGTVGEMFETVMKVRGVVEAGTIGEASLKAKQELGIAAPIVEREGVAH